jgi:hypothetical protein
MITDFRNLTRKCRIAQLMISRKFILLQPYLKEDVLLSTAIKNLYRISKSNWDCYFSPMVIQLIDFFSLFITYNYNHYAFTHMYRFVSGLNFNPMKSGFFFPVLLTIMDGIDANYFQGLSSTH